MLRAEWERVIHGEGFMKVEGVATLKHAMKTRRTTSVGSRTRRTSSSPDPPWLPRRTGTGSGARFRVAVLAERAALLLLGRVRDDGGLARPEPLDARFQKSVRVVADDLPRSAVAPGGSGCGHPEPRAATAGWPAFAGLNGRRIWVRARTGTQMEGGGFISAGRSMTARLVVERHRRRELRRRHPSGLDTPDGGEDVGVVPGLGPGSRPGDSLFFHQLSDSAGRQCLAVQVEDAGLDGGRDRGRSAHGLLVVARIVAMPSLVRLAMMRRSHCATAARMSATSRPLSVLVSTPRSRQMTDQPSRSLRSRTSARSRALRASRSSAATARASARPACVWSASARPAQPLSRIRCEIESYLGSYLEV